MAGVQLSPAAYDISSSSVLHLVSHSTSSLSWTFCRNQNTFSGETLDQIVHSMMIDSAILTTEFDIVAVRETVKAAIICSGAPIFRSIIWAPLTNVTTDAEIDNIVRNIATIGDHLVGTTFMSPKGANWGVVTLILRLRTFRDWELSMLQSCCWW